MEEKVFKKGSVIFREGDLGNSFFQILSGTAGVYSHYGEADERKLTDMKPGQYFGEMAVIEAWPRSSTIVAEDELHVIEISEKELNNYFAEQPDRILALMKQLGKRIRELTADYDEVMAYINDKSSIQPEKKSGFLAKIKHFLSSNSAANINEPSEEELMQQNAVIGKEGAIQPVTTYKKGQIIFRQGDPGLYMYAVHYGTVTIYRDYGTPQEIELTTLYPNSFFGEMGMIENEVRSATAVVTENDTILECIRAEDLEEMFRQSPVKVDMILSHLSHRLRKLTKDYMKACQEAVQNS